MKQRKPLPKEAVFALIGVGALLVALVGYMLLVKPQKSQLADVKTQIEQTRQTIEQYKAEAASNKPTAAPKIRVADIYRLARAMPSDEGMADIILELNSVAQSSGVDIDGITPEPAAAGNGFEIVGIQLRVHGDFYELTDFLYRVRTLVNVRHGQLEAGGRIFAVDQISLSPTVPGSHDLSAQVTLQTFVYGATPPGTAAAPAAPAASAPTDTSTTTTTSASAEGAP